MRLARFAVIAALAFSLTACQALEALAKNVGDIFTPCETVVYNLKALTTTADLGVLAYDTLPLCGTPLAEGKACADIKTVRKLGVYRRSAYIALKDIGPACEQDLLTAAKTAVNTFHDVAAVYAPPGSMPAPAPSP